MANEIKNFANSCLMEIDQATITQAEEALLPSVYDEELILDALAKVMNERGATGNGFKKLRALATLKGYELGTKQRKRSDILVGMVLE